MVIVGSGQTLCKATAVLATIGNADTQQVGVDNSVIRSMWCAVGVNKMPGSAQVVN